MFAPEAPDAVRRLYDPEQLRARGHALVDMLADHLAAAQAGQGAPLPCPDPEEEAARWRLPDDLPGGEDPLALLTAAVERAQHLHHPGSMGHQVPPPLPLAALADATAALLNNSAAVYEMSPAGTIMEREVVTWMCRALGLGPDAGGVLTSGGSLGILRALLAARQAVLGSTAADSATRPALLVGQHAHYSASRAAAIMGLEPGAVLPVPVDAAQRMRPDALAPCLDRAARQGLRPFALVATAGNTAAGAFDPLQPAADFCRQHGIWLHVDAAHGGAAILSPEHRHLLRGVERADSVVWDAHKMLLMPSLVTGVLFADAGHGLDTFHQDASYLLGRDAREEWFNLSHQTIECTKNTMALKVYLTLRAVGPDTLARCVERLFDLAGELARRLELSPRIELAVPPQSNIVCFRYLPDKEQEPAALDRLQGELRARVLRRGRHYLVQTVIDGTTYLRVTLMNPNVSGDDLDGLIQDVEAVGHSLETGY